MSPVVKITRWFIVAILLPRVSYHFMLFTSFMVELDAMDSDQQNGTQLREDEGAARLLQETTITHQAVHDRRHTNETSEILGVTSSDDLKWQLHIDEITAKLPQRLGFKSMSQQNVEWSPKVGLMATTQSFWQLLQHNWCQMYCLVFL